jgi:DNA polymerase (family 10)
MDLRVVPAESFGAAAHYFTGSKAHNIRVRSLAAERGLKVNEYGVFKGERSIAGGTEAEVFESLGLPFIPPEIREDQGEIEAAMAGTLPRLIAAADIRGDLHTHSDWSDGTSTIEEMARAAQRRGYRYLAICDHSPHLGVTNGLDARRLRQQAREIEAVNRRLDGFVVLKGVEVDILADGRLDLPDEALSRLDIVVASVHSRFELSREEMTRRVIRAVSPTTSIWTPFSRPVGETARPWNSTAIRNVSTWPTGTAGRQRRRGSGSSSTPTPTGPTSSA